MGTDNKSRVADIEIHWITSGKHTRGWIHTHGMDRYGLPELEVRGVPGFLAEPAARLLREVCEYMRQLNVEVRLGETMATTPRTHFRFVQGQPIPGQEDHYHPADRWQLVEIETPCDECGLMQAKLN